MATAGERTDAGSVNDIEFSYIQVYEDVRATWHRLPSPASAQWHEGDRAEFADVYAPVIAAGWMAHSFRLADAALVLAASGFTHECASLMRSVAEHVVSLKWLEQRRGDAVQLLVRANGETYRRIQASQARGWVMGDDEVQAAMQQAIDVQIDDDLTPLHHLIPFASRANDVESGILYQIWLIESIRCHANLSTAQLHVDAGTGERITLSDTPLTPGTHVESFMAIALAEGVEIYVKFLAAVEIDDVLRDWNVRLQDLKSRLGLRIDRDGLPYPVVTVAAYIEEG